VQEKACFDHRFGSLKTTEEEARKYPGSVFLKVLRNITSWGEEDNGEEGNRNSEKEDFLQLDQPGGRGLEKRRTGGRERMGSRTKKGEVNERRSSSNKSDGLNIAKRG